MNKPQTETSKLHTDTLISAIQIKTPAGHLAKLPLTEIPFQMVPSTGDTGTLTRITVVDLSILTSRNQLPLQSELRLSDPQCRNPSSKEEGLDQGERHRTRGSEEDRCKRNHPE